MPEYATLEGPIRHPLLWYRRLLSPFVVHQDDTVHQKYDQSKDIPTYQAAQTGCLEVSFHFFVSVDLVPNCTEACDPRFSAISCALSGAFQGWQSVFPISDGFVPFGLHLDWHQWFCCQLHRRYV